MERIQARAVTLTTALVACIAACVAVEVSPVQLAQLTEVPSPPTATWTVWADNLAVEVRTLIAAAPERTAQLQIPAL